MPTLKNRGKNSKDLIIDMTEEEYKTVIYADDMEMQWLTAIREGKIKNFDLSLMKKNIEEAIWQAGTGSVIGEGWHGGMSCAEWDVLYKKNVAILKEINEVIELNL
jgi:hypothetical protein